MFIVIFYYYTCPLILLNLTFFLLFYAFNWKLCNSIFILSLSFRDGQGSFPSLPLPLLSFFPPYFLPLLSPLSSSAFFLSSKCFFLCVPLPSSFLCVYSIHIRLSGSLLRSFHKFGRFIDTAISNILLLHSSHIF